MLWGSGERSRGQSLGSVFTKPLMDRSVTTKWELPHRPGLETLPAQPWATWPLSFLAASFYTCDMDAVPLPLQEEWKLNKLTDGKQAATNPMNPSQWHQLLPTRAPTARLPWGLSDEWHTAKVNPLWRSFHSLNQEHKTSKLCSKSMLCPLGTHLRKIYSWKYTPGVCSKTLQGGRQWRCGWR